MIFTTRAQRHGEMEQARGRIAISMYVKRISQQLARAKSRLLKFANLRNLQARLQTSGPSQHLGSRHVQLHQMARSASKKDSALFATTATNRLATMTIVRTKRNEGQDSHPAPGSSCPSCMSAQRYWRAAKGVQLAAPPMAAAPLGAQRITASSTEQKARTPVWLNA